MSSDATVPPLGVPSASTNANQQAKRRRMTEKRRAQNREAQRLFRERKRKKLFENIAQSTEPEYWTNDGDASLAGTDPNASTFDPPLTQPSTKEQELNDLANQLYNIDVLYARGKAPISIRGIRPELISLNWLLNDPPPSLVNPAVTYNSPCIPGSGSTSTSTATQPETVSSIPVGTASLADFEQTENLPFEVPQPEGAGLNSTPDDDADVIEVVNTNDDSISFPECSEELILRTYHAQPAEYSLRDVIKAGIQALSTTNRQVDVRLSGTPISRRNTKWSSPVEQATEKVLEDLITRPPSPYRTLVDCKAITTLRAFLANATAIGFFDPLPQDFKDPYKSPFVQSYFLQNQSVESVQQKYAHLRKSLRPLDAQCSMPHRAYIDVFPFPEFRRRILRASANGWFQMAYDELELCLDLGRGAMVCWTKGRGKHGGEPWDPRSWEIRPWFLRKWEFLIDDEMKENSRWWRHMREEYIEDLDDFTI
ncbi:hypothetical protein H072_10022 [Dactylellina haptotyla CBS 200.50]|uniref:BZIP domain-containing protein n=1 Tax=Dactylellina haptotyla (strain CBS 200.50) TaxID=1284197 RepID=S8A0E5_DACHA|nr:hypothetical protein H072_10022 [Dactylellina haptotyla CBS 200.50]